MKVVTLTVAIALSVVAVPLTITLLPKIALGHGSQTYSAHGVVQSIGADHRSVSIAHEAIPGYMGAMTMSFEASAEQLATLTVGEKVSFSFTATDDGRRILKSIAKDSAGAK